MEKSNNTANDNIPYTKLSDNSEEDKQKNESQWENLRINFLLILFLYLNDKIPRDLNNTADHEAASS